MSHDPRHAHLMALPIDNPSRPRLRDRVRSTVGAGRFLTMAAEYGRRATFARIMAHPPANVFPAWARPNSQRATVPFESGRNTLPGMEAFA